MKKFRIFTLDADIKCGQCGQNADKIWKKCGQNAALMYFPHFVRILYGQNADFSPHPNADNVRILPEICGHMSAS